MDVPGHTVVETAHFLKNAKTRLSEDERAKVVERLAEDPTAGVMMAGTGGIRKLRVASRGRGKSGSARVIYYYHDESIPVFLLDVFEKNEKANLSQAEKNELNGLGDLLVKTYRKKR